MTPKQQIDSMLANSICAFNAQDGATLDSIDFRGFAKQQLHAIYGQRGKEAAGKACWCLAQLVAEKKKRDGDQTNCEAYVRSCKRVVYEAAGISPSTSTMNAHSKPFEDLTDSTVTPPSSDMDEEPPFFSVSLSRASCPSVSDGGDVGSLQKLSLEASGKSGVAAGMHILRMVRGHASENAAETHDPEGAGMGKQHGRRILEMLTAGASTTTEIEQSSGRANIDQVASKKLCAVLKAAQTRNQHGTEEVKLSNDIEDMSFEELIGDEARLEISNQDQMHTQPDIAAKDTNRLIHVGQGSDSNLTGLAQVGCGACGACGACGSQLFLSQLQTYIEHRNTWMRPCVEGLVRAVHQACSWVLASSFMRLEGVGSVAQGLAVPGSDVDVVCMTTVSGCDAEILHRVKEAIIRSSMSRAAGFGIQLVEDARVPVLTITANNVSLDLTVNQTHSVDYAKYIQRVLSPSRNPLLRPILQCLKLWVKRRRLPGMKEGGVPGMMWQDLFLELISRQPQALSLRASSVIQGLHEFFERCCDLDIFNRVLPDSKNSSPGFRLLLEFELWRSVRLLRMLSESSSSYASHCLLKDGLFARLPEDANTVPVQTTSSFGAFVLDGPEGALSLKVVLIHHIEKKQGWAGAELPRWDVHSKISGNVLECKGKSYVEANAISLPPWGFVCRVQLHRQLDSNAWALGDDDLRRKEWMEEKCKTLLTAQGNILYSRLSSH